MNAPSSTAACAAPGAPNGAHAARKRFGGLVIGSMGVVFGDIGTSPLYGFQGAVTAASHGAVGPAEILGITSLIVWSLLIVVTIKYVMFIMRADNHGEGGILSLMALAQNALGGRTRVVLTLGVIGAALFYGDAIITPAISVLSAVEGLETVPSLAHAITPAVEITSALVLLTGSSLAQSGARPNWRRGSSICLVWFVSIATLGRAPGLGHEEAGQQQLGVIGEALFYGDAIITPAISVLSAVEGLETVPSLAHAITPAVEITSAPWCC